MAANAREWLLEGKYLDLDIVQPSTVERMLDLHTNRQANYGRQLCALITLSLWLEEWA